MCGTYLFLRCEFVGDVEKCPDLLGRLPFNHIGDNLAPEVATRILQEAGDIMFHRNDAQQWINIKVVSR